MKPSRFPSFAYLNAEGVSAKTRGDLSHEWYQHMASELREPGWMFMNFGYAEPDAPADPALAGQPGNPLATCARLYTRVAEGLVPRGKRLLEVGCGRGGGAFTVMKRFKPASLQAIDRSDHAIALCRAAFPLPGLQFQTGDAEALPFPDASFDGVLNVESSHCYADFDRFAREVHRVLIPEGRFALADMRPAAEIPRWTTSLTNAGFQLVEQEEITARVLAALRLTSAFKTAYAAEHVPAADRERFLEFAGVEGSWYFESLRNGTQRYWRFLLRK